jgi:hypothetical protein
MIVMVLLFDDINSSVSGNYSVMPWVAMVAVGDDYRNDNNSDDDTDSRKEDYI